MNLYFLDGLVLNMVKDSKFTGLPIMLFGQQNIPGEKFISWEPFLIQRNLCIFIRVKEYNPKTKGKNSSLGVMDWCLLGDGTSFFSNYIFRKSFLLPFPS